MIKTKYGHFSKDQLDSYKIKLHKELFWLLLYKDPKTKNDFQNVDFEKYLKNIQKEIDGLNSVLFYPPQVVKLSSLLEAALIESSKLDFEFLSYRKIILDAHSLVDEIWEVYHD